MTSPDQATAHLAVADLEALLHQHLGPATECLSVRRGAVGNGQETWFVDARRGDETLPLVLRRSAPAGVLDDTDRALEHATLAALEGSGLPVPRVLWADDAGSALERPYFVMERMPGRLPTRLDEEDRRAVARQVGRLLARLHAVDLDRAPERMLRPSSSRAATLDEVRRWDLRYHERRLDTFPLVGALLAWLAANVPHDDPPPVLLWGDPGPHNILVDGDDVTALLDWELAHLGHPLEDLGNAVWSCLGTFDPDQVVAGYEDGRGTAVDRDVVAYFATLGCVSRSVMQLAGVEALVRGATRALNLGGLGLSLLAANLERAARYAGWAPGPERSAPAPTPDDPSRLRPDGAEIDEAVARFLSADVLPLVDEAVAVRGLRTAVALLQAAALRARHEGAVAQRRRVAEVALLTEMARAGVDVTGGAEATARRVESDPALREWRSRTRRLLLDDLAERAVLIEPLDRLYGEQVAVVHPRVTG